MMANSIPHSLFKHPSHDVQAGTHYSGQKSQIKESASADPTHSSDPLKNDSTLSKEFSAKEFLSAKNSSRSDTLTTEKTSIGGRGASDNGFKDIFKHLVSNEVTTQQQQPREKFSSASQHLLQKSHHQDPWTSQKNTNEKEHISTLKNNKNDVTLAPTMKKSEAPSLNTSKKEVSAAKSGSKSEGMSPKSSQKEPTDTTSSHASSQSIKNQSETSSFKQRSTQQDLDTSSDVTHEESSSHVISKVRSIIPEEANIQAISYEAIDDSLTDQDDTDFPSILFNPFLSVSQNQFYVRDTKIHPALDSIMTENNGHKDLTIHPEIQEKRDLINHIDGDHIEPDHTDLAAFFHPSFKTAQHNNTEKNDAFLKANDTPSSTAFSPTHDMVALSSMDNSSLTMLIGKNTQKSNESNISLILDEQDTIQTVSQDASQDKLSSHTLDFVDDGDVLKQPQAPKNLVNMLHSDEIEQKNAFFNPLISSVKNVTSQQSNEDDAATLSGISKITTKDNITTMRDVSQDTGTADAQKSLQYFEESSEPQRSLSEFSNTVTHGTKMTSTFGSGEILAKNQIPSMRDVYMQVAQDFRDSLQLRQSSFDIQLKPEGLGTVHIHIQFDKKTVEATFHVEQNALPMFLQNRDHIAEIFSSQGFNMDQNGLTFSLNQGQQHNHQKQENSQNTFTPPIADTNSVQKSAQQENMYSRQITSPSPDRSNTQGTFVIHV